MADPNETTGTTAVVSSGPPDCGRQRGGCARAESAKNLPRPNVPDWTRQPGEGVGLRPYGQSSKYEKDVVRRTVPWLTRPGIIGKLSRLCIELDGMIAPNGLCFERHHGGIAEIDPADCRLMLHGLVDEALVFTLNEFERLPRVNKICFILMCGRFRHGMAGCQLRGCEVHARAWCIVWKYTGVVAEGLAGTGGLKPSAKWIMAEGAVAAAMNRSIR